MLLTMADDEQRQTKNENMSKLLMNSDVNHSPRPSVFSPVPLMLHPLSLAKKLGNNAWVPENYPSTRVTIPKASSLYIAVLFLGDLDHSQGLVQG